LQVTSFFLIILFSIVDRGEELIPTNLKDIPLFHSLSAQDLERVGACLKEKKFQKGEILFHEGKACERVFVVRSGRVKLYRMSSSGREQILEMLNEGDTCACNPGQASWSCTTTAEAVTPCTVWFLSREHYVELVKSSAQLTQTLNQIFADRLKCFSALIEEVSLNDSKKRVAQFLFDMLKEKSVDHINENKFILPYTREEIAQRIGTTRETVARQLHQLQKDKLIDIKGRQIIITNKNGLSNLLQS
jgi:CRP/FNR family transcriptional regulator